MGNALVSCWSLDVLPTCHDTNTPLSSSAGPKGGVVDFALSGDRVGKKLVLEGCVCAEMLRSPVLPLLVSQHFANVYLLSQQLVALLGHFG